MARRKIVRLNLFFIVMDLLTVLAYPIVFVHGKLLRGSNSKGSIQLAKYLVPVPVTPAGPVLTTYSGRKYSRKF
jgi:hypothetical protein